MNKGYDPFLRAKRITRCASAGDWSNWRRTRSFRPRPATVSSQVRCCGSRKGNRSPQTSSIIFLGDGEKPSFSNWGRQSVQLFAPGDKMYKVHQGATLLPIDVQCQNYTVGEDSIPAVTASASRDAHGRSRSDTRTDRARRAHCRFRTARGSGDALCFGGGLAVGVGMDVLHRNRRTPKPPSPATS
jgi:hypothetical protein